MAITKATASSIAPAAKGDLVVGSAMQEFWQLALTLISWWQTRLKALG
jgi:hypothetical protein